MSSRGSGRGSIVECSYELAESMLEFAKKEIDGVGENVVENVHRLVNAVEYLAKALIYAADVGGELCNKARKRHEVSRLLIEAYAKAPIPLSEEDAKAVVGIAFLNAMLCNSVVRDTVRYGVEPFGMPLQEAVKKSPNILYEWEKVLRHTKELLDKYYTRAEEIVKRVGTLYIEVTQHSFVEEQGVKRARFVLLPRPTARYAHARVRIKLPNDGRRYRVEVKFIGEAAVAPVRCEVCIWEEEDEKEKKYRLVNDDSTGSPRDYIYLAGGEGVIVVDVKGGQEVEPRVWKPGGVKKIEVVIEKESSGN